MKSDLKNLVKIIIGSCEMKINMDYIYVKFTYFKKTYIFLQAQ